MNNGNEITDRAVEAWEVSARGNASDGGEVEISEREELTDKNGHVITPGSVLWSDDGYAVIVRQADGHYYGQLICSPADSCAGMPYALNSGRRYTLLEAAINAN